MLDNRVTEWERGKREAARTGSVAWISDPAPSPGAEVYFNFKLPVQNPPPRAPQNTQMCHRTPDRQLRSNSRATSLNRPDPSLAISLHRAARQIAALHWPITAAQVDAGMRAPEAPIGRVSPFWKENRAPGWPPTLSRRGQRSKKEKTTAVAARDRPVQVARVSASLVSSCCHAVMLPCCQRRKTGVVGGFGAGEIESDRHAHGGCAGLHAADGDVFSDWGPRSGCFTITNHSPSGSKLTLSRPVKHRLCIIWNV